MENKISIKVLGSGSAFSTKNGNTQLYFNNKDNPLESLLIDVGETTQYNFDRCQFPSENVRNIFITHGHPDHIGGLGTLGFKHYFFPNLPKRPCLYVKRELGKRIWNEFLSIQMETLADGQLPAGKIKADINDFFNMVYIGENTNFMLGNIEFKPFATIHIVNGSEFMDSFGLSITLPNKKNIVITGDTQFAPSQLNFLFEKADLIITDCETTKFKSLVHANYQDLATLKPEIKTKMLLVHYNDNLTPELEKEILDNHGFKGFLHQNDEINLDF